MVVVDLDFIDNVRVEGEIRRAVRRFQERVNADNEGDGRRWSVSGLIRAVADKGIQVRNVGLVIESGNGSFAMVRGKTLPGSNNTSASSKATKVRSLFIGTLLNVFRTNAGLALRGIRGTFTIGFKPVKNNN